MDRETESEGEPVSEHDGGKEGGEAAEGVKREKEEKEEEEEEKEEKYDGIRLVACCVCGLVSAR